MSVGTKDRSETVKPDARNFFAIRI